jgi:hypothetical protein
LDNENQVEVLDEKENAHVNFFQNEIHDKTDLIVKNLRGHLNKLTEENFNILSVKISDFKNFYCNNENDQNLFANIIIETVNFCIFK